MTELPLSLTLSTVIGLLRRALFAWVGRGPLRAVVMVLISNRLGVVAARLERMVVRFAAERAMSRLPRVEVVSVGDEVAVRRVAPVRFWPLGFGWLLDVKRHEAAWFTNAVERLLREPEMVGLLAASKAARRLLRPMCRMLGVDPALLCPPAPGEVVAPVVRTARVRTKKPPVDFGRVPLPRGVLSSVRKQKRAGTFRMVPSGG